jgi:putative ABC transport system substrate-binding protein
MIGRRTLARVLVLGVVTMPVAADAQPAPGKTARIGYLSFRSGPTGTDEAFRQGLRELGYVEGQNIAIEYRYADFKRDRAATLAAELVRLKVDVIVSTGGSAPAAAAKRATTTIPIVFDSGNPVENGLVTRLDRPDGNLTGINNFTSELNVKRLELLKAVLPSISRVAVVVNPRTSPMVPLRLKELEDAARVLRVKLHVREAREPREIDDAFTAIARERPEALLVMNDPMFFSERKRIVDLAARYHLPGIFMSREFAEAGGLLSYAPSFADIYRRLATYVDRILKGAKPGDLPVEQPTKFEFVINLRTAKALRLAIPQSVVNRADHVILP